MAPQASQSSNSSFSAQRHRGADAAIDALHVLQAIGVSFIDHASRLGGPIDGIDGTIVGEEMMKMMKRRAIDGCGKMR